MCNWVNAKHDTIQSVPKERLGVSAWHIFHLKDDTVMLIDKEKNVSTLVNRAIEAECRQYRNLVNRDNHCKTLHRIHEQQYERMQKQIDQLTEELKQEREQSAKQKVLAGEALVKALRAEQRKQHEHETCDDSEMIDVDAEPDSHGGGSSRHGGGKRRRIQTDFFSPPN